MSKIRKVFTASALGGGVGAVVKAAKVVGKSANPIGWRWELMLDSFRLGCYVTVTTMIAFIPLVFLVPPQHPPKVFGDLVLVLIVSFLVGCFFHLIYRSEKERGQVKTEIRYCNPLRFYFYYLPLSVLWVVRRMPRGVIFGAGLVKRFFILIH